MTQNIAEGEQPPIPSHSIMYRVGRLLIVLLVWCTMVIGTVASSVSVGISTYLWMGGIEKSWVSSLVWPAILGICLTFAAIGGMARRQVSRKLFELLD